MMKKRLVFLVAILCFNNVIRARSRIMHSNKEHFCGSRLVMALSLICETYNSPSEVEDEFSQENDGIVETCCQRPCSMSILASYCGSLRIDTKQSTESPTRSSKRFKGKKKFSKRKKAKKYNETKKKNKKNKMKENRKNKRNHRKHARLNASAIQKRSSFNCSHEN